MSLEYLGRGFINFGDTSCRWINLKRFRFDQPAAAHRLLADLLADRHYRDLYMSPDSHERDSMTLHGPYRIAEITPACFDPVDTETAVGVVEGFCNLNGQPPPAQIRQEIDEQVLSAVRGGECFWLRELPDAIHEIDFVLWEFRELVVIDRHKAELLLLVMAID